MENTSDKLRVTASLLAFFFGALGIHRFYVGKNGTGVLQLLLTLSFVGAIVSGVWATIDLIMILTGTFRDGSNKILVKWTEM